MKRTTLIGLTSSIALALPLMAHAGASQIAATEKMQNQVAQQSSATPYAANSLKQAAQNAGSFNTWLKAMEKAGLTNLLDGSTRYTVLAPTDDAFAKLPSGALDSLMKDQAKLQQVLKTHIIAQDLMAKDVPIGQIRAISGHSLEVDAQRKHKLVVEGAQVTLPDITAANGVIHGIDRLILTN